LIGHEYPPYHIGGVGSYTRDLAKFLSKRKVPTTVFCGKSEKIREEQVNDYLRIVRLPLLDLPLRAYWFQIKNHPLLRRRLREYDLVHVVNAQAAAVCAFAKPKNTPMLTTVHEVPIFRTKAFFNSPVSDWCLHDFVSSFVELPVNQILYTSCFRESKKIIAVSHNLDREIRIAFHRAAGDKITVIYNGIDFEKTRQRPAMAGDSRQDRPAEYLLFFGRHVTVKGIPLLLRAVSELRTRFPNLAVKIAGTGPQSGALQKLAAELSLLANVQFLGRVDELEPLIMNCSFAVLPSSYEVGPSLAVLEAMSCGKAVIALDYAFSRELIEDSRTGLLARPGDPHDLAEKMELMIKDENFRNQLGANAFQHAYRFFNWENLIESYVNLYRDMAAS
jgi:glycosyltransferase involved in cell wall biosynthesis